jgi:two-component system cell cycle sensor histidine kinase/response regulator CckA
VLVVRDVTEREHLEQELARASKLESIGILAGGIAHDFNNILTAIIGNLSLAKESVRSWNGNEYLLSETERAALRAKKLVKQLLTFSRGGVPVRKVTQIGDLLRDSAGFSLSGSNVSCEFAIADDLQPVNVDEGQISQVIDNLVINAKQAMPGGGTIRIAADNLTVEGYETDCEAQLRPGRYVRVTVEDHGLGIPKEHLARIFDPYFTTKQTGSGLGLATTYSIVKKHEGWISVRSEVGVGSAFSVYLPASAQTAAQDDGAMPLKKGGGTILVMDDEELVRTVTGKMLEHLGYSVTFACNGDEALAQYGRAQQSGHPFDAVIMDVTIPAGMGGKEAIGRLREMDPGVRAIVSSGYSEEAITADFAAHGFCGALTKPYEMHELAAAVRDALQDAT